MFTFQDISQCVSLPAGHRPGHLVPWAGLDRQLQRRTERAKRDERDVRAGIAPRFERGGRTSRICWSKFFDEMREYSSNLHPVQSLLREFPSGIVRGQALSEGRNVTPNSHCVAMYILKLSARQVCPLRVVLFLFSEYLCKHQHHSFINPLLRRETMKLHLNSQLKLEADVWLTCLEQTLVFLLIIGRGVMPRGQFSHEELSLLLIYYLGIGSDIIELLTLFGEDYVLKDKKVVWVTLAVWSFSLLQFVAVLASTKTVRKSDGKYEEYERRLLGCSVEVWTIFCSLLMQDGPFLFLRLYVMKKNRTVTFSILFFTLKNVLMLVVQTYRLVAISCCSEGTSTRREKQQVPSTLETTSDAWGEYTVAENAESEKSNPIYTPHWLNWTCTKGKEEKKSRRTEHTNVDGSSRIPTKAALVVTPHLQLSGFGKRSGVALHSSWMHPGVSSAPEMPCSLPQSMLLIPCTQWVHVPCTES